MTHQSTTPDEVLTFWTEAGPEKWWNKDGAFDAEIKDKFLATHTLAKDNELTAWQNSSDHLLALIIVLDQFSRNLFRNDANAFAQDEQCLALVHQSIASGADRLMRKDIGMFAYLPLMHSENISDQKLCLREMERLGLENEAKFAKIHLDIIEEFGRFPHRNQVLGREISKAEAEFLKNGGFAG